MKRPDGAKPANVRRTSSSTRAPRSPGRRSSSRRLRESGKPFLVLTNNSIYTPRDLSARLAGGGLEVPEECIWTSALATAKFLDEPAPGRHGVRDRRGPG